jgi:hypothetical protein
MQNQLKTLISNLLLFKRVFIVTIVLALLAVIGVWFLLEKTTGGKNDYYANIPAKTYSLSGVVRSYQNNFLTIEVGAVVSEKDGSRLVYKDYTVKISDDTRVMKLTDNADAPFSETDLSELSKAIDVIIYTNQNPYTEKELKAARVDIMQEREW